MDGGECFQIILEEDENGLNKSGYVIAIENLQSNDSKNIFLIDHIWTFRLNSARLALEETASLRENLTSVFGIDIDDRESDLDSKESSDDEENNSKVPSTSKSKNNQEIIEKKTKNFNLINKILDEMWRYAQFYTIRVNKTTMNEGDLPVWYLPDEFGMRIGHNFESNCRMIPFYYFFDNMAYSLLFPIRNIADREEVTRNYLNNILFNLNPNWRTFLMHPWHPEDVIFDTENDNFIRFSPKDDNFFESGRVDKLPDSQPNFSNGFTNKSSTKTLRIFASDNQLIKNLNSINYEIVNDIYEADIIWLREHFHDFKDLAERNPKALINQFPYESVLTVKDLCSALIQNIYEKEGNVPFIKGTLDINPEWFPITFNLNLELPQFIKYFKQREKFGLDNTWILKPWNLARGLDVYVTRNINCVIRLAESSPKIVSKYLHNPVLIIRPDNQNLVKFDLRFIVFLKSVDPLDAAIYNNFWIRFAANEYNLHQLDDVLTHLTVHNYNSEVNILNVKCNEFIEQFEKQYSNIKWSSIQQQIYSVIKKVLKAVSLNKPPQGIAPNYQSRAMYGFDLMLYWKDELNTEIGVSFIEANFMPDCERACNFYPDFADTVFNTLFLNKKLDNVTNL